MVHQHQLQPRDILKSFTFEIQLYLTSSSSDEQHYQQPELVTFSSLFQFLVLVLRLSRPNYPFIVQLLSKLYRFATLFANPQISKTLRNNFNHKLQFPPVLVYGCV